MLANPTLNLFPELQFLIFNGLSVATLGRLRRVCKKFSLCPCLKNILDTHEDHVRIRFEKVVYTAKPFFPKKMRNWTRVEDMYALDKNLITYRYINIAKKIVGGFYYDLREEIVCWNIHCRLPQRWSDFILHDHDKINYRMILREHFIETKNPSVCYFPFYDDYGLTWRPRKSQITESTYINYAEAEIQFWAVFA